MLEVQGHSLVPTFSGGAPGTVSTHVDHFPHWPPEIQLEWDSKVRPGSIKKNSLKPLLTTSSWNKIRCFQVFSFSSSMVFCRRFVDPNNKKRELTTPKKKNTLHVTLSQSPPPKKKKQNKTLWKKSQHSAALSAKSPVLLIVTPRSCSSARVSVKRASPAAFAEIIPALQILGGQNGCWKNL